MPTAEEFQAALIEEFNKAAGSDYVDVESGKLHRAVGGYPHHMADGHDYDFSAPVAEVTRHPTDPRLWGLKNLSGAKWVTTLSDGKLKDLVPGRSVLLAPNTKIAFGQVDGQIEH